MAYNQQPPYQPPNGRYYSSKASGPQPAPRFAPQPQPRRVPHTQQQYNPNDGGYEQSQSNYAGNPQYHHDQNYSGTYVNDDFDDSGNRGYGEYGQSGYEGHGQGYHDEYEYGNEAYNSQYYSNSHSNLSTHGVISNVNGQYQQPLPAYPIRGGDQRGPPSSGEMPQQQSMYQQRSALTSPPPQQREIVNAAPQRPNYWRSRSDGPGDRGRPPPPHTQQRSQEKQRNPRERSKPRKPLIEQASPDALAWDNPFPTFPTKKPAKNSTDTIDDRMAKASLEPARHSEDLPRPSMASLDQPRPSLDGQLQKQQVPNNPVSVTGPRMHRGESERGYANKGQSGQPTLGNGPATSVNAPSRSQPPPIQTQSAPRPSQQSPSSATEPRLKNFMDRSMTTPPEAISRAQQVFVPGFGQGTSYHGPDSPSFVPRGYQSFSPPPQGSSAQQMRDSNTRPEPFSPDNHPSGHMRHDTIEEVYNGYYDNHQYDDKNPPMRDREAEIEAEMPNFDDPLGERNRPKATSNPIVSASPPNNGRPSPDFYQQARAQRSQPDLQSQARAGQGPDSAILATTNLPNRGLGEGAGSPPYQQSNNIYSRPAYTALAQTKGPAAPQIVTASSAFPPRQTNTPQGRHMQSPVSPHQPPLNRYQTNHSQRSDPGPGYEVSPLDTDMYQRPATAQTSRPSFDRQPSNPDALPEHPTPAQTRPPGRPGLPHNMTGLPQNRPAPVRQYNRINTAVPTVTSQISPQTPRTRTSDERRRSVPITPQELDRLRAAAKANPSDQKLRLRFAKKLVEAAAILADEGGRADARTRDKNRERYILDAHKEVKRLASQGYPEAQFYLADCYGQGALGLQVDTKEAFTLYQAAAKAGHAPSAYRTAVCCEMGPEDGGGTRKDPIKAVQWYKRGASLGDVPAMYKIGMVLLKGLLGQQPNLGEALIWLKRAADRADEDNPHALHELGLLYESQMPGQDKIIRDERYAFELFSRAAALRYKFSQFRLGQSYEYGLLTCPIDARQSIQWYTRAASQGEHQSELALSGWYLTGSPGILEQSDTEAYLWARKAATADPVPLPKAMFAMGYFTEVGIGCPRSLEEAKRWYGRAAAYKFPKAQERLEELKKGGPKVQKNRERLSRSNKDRNDAECVVM
ncbi:MAG: hypothetical protein M1822_005367 [Bathelium mastoideum]|nr:MAG: hypothetical protein M1822_005367 [Bathelium mastoideum]